MKGVWKDVARGDCQPLLCSALTVIRSTWNKRRLIRTLAQGIKYLQIHNKWNQIVLSNSNDVNKIPFRQLNNKL